MDQSSDIRLLCDKNDYYYPSWCGIAEAVVGSNAFSRDYVFFRYRISAP
jgi:hypothetical protein